MTRYEQGFMNKCAEYGVPEHVAGQMLKVAYELGSVSTISPDPNPNIALRPDYESFANTDYAAGYNLPGAGEGKPIHLIGTESQPSEQDARAYLRKWLARPYSAQEQMDAYDWYMNNHPWQDGLIRRSPLVEDGKYKSTSWKDNKDLANLQSDAIRHRRGVGKPLVYDKKTQSYLPQ